MNFSQDGILLIDRRINFSAHSTISKLWSILIDPSIGQPGHDRCDRLVKSRSMSSSSTTSSRRTSYFRKIPQPQEEDIHVSYIPGGKILKETNWNFRSLLFFSKRKGASNFFLYIFLWKICLTLRRPFRSKILTYQRLLLQFNVSTW